MTVVYLKIDTKEKTWSEVTREISLSEILSDLESAKCEYEILNSIPTFLDGEIPDVLKDDLEIVINRDGEQEVLDLSQVLDKLALAQDDPLGTTAYFLKVRQGISNWAYAMEEYYNRTEDAFRVWRAELERTLNLQDDRNPLVKEGSKTTNGAIEAYIRSQPEYKGFKDSLSQIHSGKQSLWMAKTALDTALEVLNTTLADR